MLETEPIKLLGKIALDKGFITEYQLKEALKHQKEQKGKSLGDIFIQLGYLKKEQLDDLLSIHHKKVTFVDDLILGNLLIENDLLKHKELEKLLKDRPSEKRLGDYLIELKVISPDELEAILKSQERLHTSHYGEEKVLLQCPSCGMRFQIKDPTRPRDVRCGKCKFIFQVGERLIISMTSEEKALDSKLGETLAANAPTKKDSDETIAAANRTMAVEAEHLIEGTTDINQETIHSFRSFLKKFNLRPDAELASKSKHDTTVNESGRYIYESEIGRGGMGSILATRDLDTRRNIVTKVLLQKSSRVAILRFIEEAQITAQLEHPNIVPIYDIGVNAEGNIFYTMKHVKGESLQAVINNASGSLTQTTRLLTENRIIEILIDVCHAVAFAHSKGVIHRDLKPDNIMIGEYGEVILMDFGLAKILHREISTVEELNEQITSDRHEQDELKTIQGVVAGTPKFMAPEQASGHVHEQDERTDIFALGAILFACIAGDSPTPGSGVHEVLNNVVKGKRNEFPEYTPSELRAIINKAMALQKDDRYLSVKDFSNDLDLYLRGYSISAKEDSFREMTTKWVKRNTAVFITSITALLILLIGSIFAIQKVWHEKEEAIGNLNKFLLAQKTAEEEKALKEKLEKEKVKKWKEYYKEDFQNLEYHPIANRPQDLGFGNWAYYEFIKGKPSNNINDLTNYAKESVWHKDRYIHFYGSNDCYLYLNKEIYGNVRIDFKGTYNRGETPELSLFLAGSIENQERDGYTIAINQMIKFQKRGKTIFNKDIPKSLKAYEEYHLRFERETDIIRVFLNEMDRPIFEWEDPDPIYGEKNSICGIYVWNGEIKFNEFTVTKQAWAKQNSPMDYAERIRKKGYYKLAIEEYREIMFSTDDIIDKAEAFFEMGITYKMNEQKEEAKRIFSTFINRETHIQYGLKISYDQIDHLVKRSYVFLFLMALDEEFHKFDMEKNQWPPQIKKTYDQVIKNCAKDDSIELIFNYVLSQIINKETNPDKKLKAIKLLKSFFELLKESSIKRCQGPYAEVLWELSKQYTSANNHSTAEILLDEAVAIHPDDFRIVFQRCIHRLKFSNDKKKLEETYHDLLRLKKNYPEYAYTYVNLANYYDLMENHEKAIESLKEGLEVTGNQAYFIPLLSSYFLNEKKHDEFLAIINQLKPQNQQQRILINYYKGFYLYQKKQPKELQKIIDAFEEFDQNTPEFKHLNCLLHILLKNYDLSIKYLNELPGNASSSRFAITKFRMLTYCYLETQQEEQAYLCIKRLKEISRLYPDELAVYEELKKKFDKK